MAKPAAWPLATGLGGLWGDALVGLVRMACEALRFGGGSIVAGVLFLPLALWGIGYAIGLRLSDFGDALAWGGDVPSGLVRELGENVVTTDRPALGVDARARRGDPSASGCDGDDRPADTALCGQTSLDEIRA